ncbi:MAG: PAC2 family protein [Miltoncostaeaceae bacterium]
MDHLTWTERPDDLRDPIMLVAFRGWNDAAASASTALATMGEALGAHRVGVINPDEFFDFQTPRPMIDTTVNGPSAVTWPDVEIYVARVPDGEHDLVLITGSEPSMRWRSFTRTLLGAGSALGVGRMILLGSLLADVVHTSPVHLTGLSPDPDVASELGLRAPSYEGPTGIIGVLQHSAAEHGIQALSLWAPVSHYAAGITNTKASLALVRALPPLTGVSIESSELERASEEFESQVSQAVGADPRLRQLVERIQEAAAERAQTEVDEADLPSGDELAAELERYLRERSEGGED